MQNQTFRGTLSLKVNKRENFLGERGGGHWLNMLLDLHSLFGLLCTAVLIGSDPAASPPPLTFGLIYEGAIGQPR